MMELSGSERNSTICLAVLTVDTIWEFHGLTDRFAN